MIWPLSTCTDCGAVPGAPCRTATRHTANRAHVSRVDAELARVADLARAGVADFRAYQERRAVKAARERRVMGT